jgi:selenocysteine lyase/cysteine desulfurase
MIVSARPGGRMTLADAQRLWDAGPGWLNTASYGLPPRPAFEALTRALDEWRAGGTPWEVWDEATGRSRAAFARLLGLPASDVTVGSSVSQLLAPVATALPRGARVLVPDREFTSNLFPWLVAPGVAVRTVPADQLADRIEAGTDLVAFSLVQSSDGTVADYSAITRAAREYAALVVVDATQACGWLPFDASQADAVVVHAYKWLMSPRGSAFAYLSPRLQERLTPHAAGWYAGEDVFASFYGPPLRLARSARRFDLSPAWFSWVGTAPALELLEEIGVEAVYAHNLRLANRFLEGLGEPAGASAIATVDRPGAEEKLRSAGVRAAVRGGRVRASFHLYSTDRDVDLALDALTRTTC